jgi:hypothetical protein
LFGRIHGGWLGLVTCMACCWVALGVGRPTRGKKIGSIPQRPIIIVRQETFSHGLVTFPAATTSFDVAFTAVWEGCVTQLVKHVCSRLYLYNKSNPTERCLQQNVIQLRYLQQ